MRINSINRINTINGAKRANNPGFGLALSTKQEKEYLELQRQVNEAEGKNGMRVVKFYSKALPSSPESDTGIGKLNSPEARNFYRMAKVYGGATAVKAMPVTQLTDKPVYNDRHKPCAYDGSALTIGEDQINLERLTSKDYGEILPKSEFDNFVAKHKQFEGDLLRKFINNHESELRPELRIDFDTTLGWSNQEAYPVNEPLRVAFNNFLDKNNQSPEINKLRKEFEEFKNWKGPNPNDPIDFDGMYTKIALFPWLKDYTTAGLDPEKMARFDEIKEQQSYDVEFFKFKQFLAKKAIKEGVELAHKEGVELFGDCPIGFSWVEQQVFPDAFIKDQYGREGQMGSWGIAALNFHDLINDESQNSPAHQLLKAKLVNMLDIFDGLRLDVGWSYMCPSYHFGDHQMIRLSPTTQITKFIEKIAEETKGKEFDQRKIIYECDADGNDFNLWQHNWLLKQIKGLGVLSTEEEKNDNANVGWGNYSFLKENIGLHDEDFVLGTNNHDKNGILWCAEQDYKSDEHVGAMLRVFKRRPEDGYPDAWKELKDHQGSDAHRQKYSRARFAEIDYAKHQFILSNDLFGRRDKIDYHSGGIGTDNADKDYQMRMERNFEENAHRAWQAQIGYNLADVKQFRASMDGSKSKHKDLYDKLEKYAEYIKKPGHIYTREAADDSKYANLDISKMSKEEIKNMDVNA